MVNPSGEPPLAEQHAPGYRRFASVISAVPSEREAALAALPAEIQALSPTSLISLVLGLGHALEPTSRERSEAHAAALTATSVAMATRIARGMDLLSRWPHDLRQEISRQLDSAEADPNSRRTLGRRLRRLGDPDLVPADQAAVLRTALPEAFVTLSRSFALTGQVMLASEIAREAGIAIDQVRKLEFNDVITGVETRKGKRIYRQYPYVESQRVIRLWRGSESCTRLEQRLSIPRYAVEQLVCLGEVDPELSTIATVLDSNLRLITTSVDQLVVDLDARMRRNAAPGDAVQLAAVTRTTGGKLKPWGALIGAMRRGDVPLWPSSDHDDRTSRGWRWVRRVLVRPSDLEPVMAENFDNRRFPDFLFTDIVSQLDACEILNCNNPQIREVIGAGDLEFVAAGQGLWASMTSVLQLAERTITIPELGRLLALPKHPLVKIMSEHCHVRKASLGWLRADVEVNFPALLRAAVEKRSTEHGLPTGTP